MDNSAGANYILETLITLAAYSVEQLIPTLTPTHVFHLILRFNI